MYVGGGAQGSLWVQAGFRGAERHGADGTACSHEEEPADAGKRLQHAEGGDKGFLNQILANQYFTGWLIVSVCIHNVWNVELTTHFIYLLSPQRLKDKENRLYETIHSLEKVHLGMACACEYYFIAADWSYHYRYCIHFYYRTSIVTRRRSAKERKPSQTRKNVFSIWKRKIRNWRNSG